MFVAGQKCILLQQILYWLLAKWKSLIGLKQRLHGIAWFCKHCHLWLMFIFRYTTYFFRRKILALPFDVIRSVMVNLISFLFDISGQHGDGQACPIESVFTALSLIFCSFSGHLFITRPCPENEQQSCESVSESDRHTLTGNFLQLFWAFVLSHPCHENEQQSCNTIRESDRQASQWHCELWH